MGTLKVRAVLPGISTSLNQYLNGWPWPTLELELSLLGGRTVSIEENALLLVSQCCFDSLKMSDMEVDTPAPTGKAKSKEDGKDSKKRFEVKKVAFMSFAFVASLMLATVECCIALGMGCALSAQGILARLTFTSR
jgi:hypothetical protein